MPLAPDEWSFKELVRLNTSPPWKWESGSGKTLAFDSLWPPKFPEFLQVEKKWMILAISFSKPFVVLQALYAFSLCSIFSRLKKPSMFDWYLCIYMYTHTHLYMCIMCVYIYVYTYIHTRICMCVYIYYFIEQSLCDIGRLCSVLLCVPSELFNHLLWIWGWELCTVQCLWHGSEQPVKVP